MSFTVEMPVDQISVDAGSTAPLAITVKNLGADADQFEVQVEGLDPDWTAVPVHVINLNGSAHQSEKVFFKPPRVSESQAGNYPFVLKVRSLSSGESQMVQGILTIKPYHYLSIEISPKKGVVSPMRKENVFETTVMNLGNSEHSLQLFGNDPEDALTYSFEQEQVILGPGQTKVIEVTATPVRSRPFASARLHGFSIGARSIEAPSVVCSAQAQLEERALLSPGMLALGIFVIVLFAGWLALLPKPPEMELLKLSKDIAFEGDMIEVRWKANNARRVQIRMGGETLVDTPEEMGSESFIATKSGTIEAIAIADGKQSGSLTESLTVNERPIVPEPEITSFSISPRTVNKGEKLTVRYKVNDAVTKLTLAPTNQILDTKIDTIFVPADVLGTITYELVAENKEGKAVREKQTVTVVDGTLPRVDEFKSNPPKIDGDFGVVIISWRTTNAVRLELVRGTEKFDITETVGTREFTLEESTDFVLNAYDAQNRKTAKRIRVEVKPVEPTIDPPTTTGGATPPTTGGGPR